MDPVPDPLLLRKSGSAGNRTRNLCICSQKLWPLDHRGSPIQKQGIIYTIHKNTSFIVWMKCYLLFLDSRNCTHSCSPPFPWVYTTCKFRLTGDMWSISIIKLSYNFVSLTKDYVRFTNLRSSDTFQDTHYKSTLHSKFYEITNRCSYMQSILFHC